jgi:peptidoglycan/LPS O-acetylase OafA/YrhL
MSSGNAASRVPRPYHPRLQKKTNIAVNTPTTRRFDGLDTLRAIAIVLVFMYHYQVFVSREATFGLGSTLGWTGVDLFFVLSGYLIGNQIFSGLAKGETLSLKAFYIRRFLRTLPNFYVVLALFFLFPAVMGGRTPPPLWRFLTFTQNIGLEPGTAFSHAWSLCIEEQFYLLLPAVALLLVATRRSVAWGWVLVIGGIAAGMTYRHVVWTRTGLITQNGAADYYTQVYYSSFGRFDEFLPGVAVAMLKNFHGDTWTRVMRHGQAWLAAGLLSVVAVGWLLNDSYFIDGHGYGWAASTFGYSLVAMAFALLVLAALSPSSWLYRVRVPGAAALAAWSYAIYLTHKPIAQIIKAQWGPAIPGKWALVAVAVAASLLGGWLLYRLVETPFMMLRERYFPSSFPPVQAKLPADTQGVSP